MTNDSNKSITDEHCAIIARFRDNAGSPAIESLLTRIINEIRKAEAARQAN